MWMYAVVVVVRYFRLSDLLQHGIICEISSVELVSENWKIPKTHQNEIENEHTENGIESEEKKRIKKVYCVLEIQSS